MDIKILHEYTKDIRVLYVEDDVMVRDSTCTLLESYFLEVVCSVDALDALEKIKNLDTFDLIISDINMPSMSGIEFAKIVLDSNPEMPIIFLSAYNDSVNLQEAIDLGISSFLSKPMRKDRLEKAIFKASQVISDRKFVMSHVDLIEKLNLQLEEQNYELSKKNNELEKSLRLLDTMVNKEQVLHIKTEAVSPSKNNDAAFEAQIEQLVNEDLHELREIHTEIDASVIKTINNISDFSQNDIDNIINRFTKYSSILTYYNFFNNLSSSMKAFSLMMKDNPIPEPIEEKENMFMLLESFLYVLEKWQNELESGNTEMINFFDASIINDMTTITNMWIKSPQEEEDFGEMEFF